MKNQDRKRRGPWIDILLIGSIIILASAIAFFTVIGNDFKFQKTSASENEKHAEQQSSEITEAESKFPGIRIVTDISNDDTMPYAIQYPQTEYDDLNESILHYITVSKDRYITAMRLKTNAEKDETKSGELNISFETYPYKDHYYSFVLTQHFSTDSDTYETSIQTFFFNNETGEILTIRTLLNQDLASLETFSNHVRSQILENVEYKGQLSKDAMLAKTEPKWRLFQRFAIQDESLVIYFDKGEIIDPAVGVPTVVMPLSYLNPLLAEQFQEQMASADTIVSDKENQKEIKRVALTFDDGPDPKATKQILQLLDKYDAKATFFMLGSRVQYYPDIAKEVYDAGHEIGNHSWSHPMLTKLSSKQVLEEFNSTEKAIMQAIGKPATVFRPPYGATNQRVNGLIPTPVVNWSIDTLDWKHRDASKLLPSVKNHMHNNAIILMHDIHISTAEGLEPVLQYLQNEGYQFVTVSEILPYR